MAWQTVLVVLTAVLVVAAPGQRGTPPPTASLVVTSTCQDSGQSSSMVFNDNHKSQPTTIVFADLATTVIWSGFKMIGH